MTLAPDPCFHRSIILRKVQSCKSNYSGASTHSGNIFSVQCVSQLDSFFWTLVCSLVPKTKGFSHFFEEYIAHPVFNQFSSVLHITHIRPRTHVHSQTHIQTVQLKPSQIYLRATHILSSKTPTTMALRKKNEAGAKNGGKKWTAGEVSLSTVSYLHGTSFGDAPVTWKDYSAALRFNNCDRAPVLFTSSYFIDRLSESCQGTERMSWHISLLQTKMLSLYLSTDTALWIVLFFGDTPN